MTSEIDPRILEYIQILESGENRQCLEQVALAEYVRKCFDTEDIYTDSDLLDKYLGLAKYFPFKRLFPWEAFLSALWDCTFWRETNLPRWPDVLCMVGRGAGKDGYIAFNAACSVSPYNRARSYDVDICANNEDQATRPVKDLVEALETPEWETKLKKHYYHTKELVKGRKNGGEVKGHTNNPKGRDGLRPGKIIFNEVHQYENYDNISVFTGGLGKKDDPRTGFFTSNGEISDGPLDDYLEEGRGVLFDGQSDKGRLPFICCLNDVSQVHDPDNWAMANPSLPYRPILLTEIQKEYDEWLVHPERNPQFLPKRFGIRAGQKELAVTAYEKIQATNKPLPDLSRWSCTVGVDYAELNDWAAVNLHFRRGQQRFDINHYWICLKSKTLSRIKAPWKEWVQRGLATAVDDVSIHPRLLAEYILQAAKKYNIVQLAMDHFRWTLVSEEMKRIGFDANDKTRVKLIRPSDIMAVEPVIQDCFDRDLFTWGDNPGLRWAVNNTKRCRASKKTSDTGNYYYAKIEGKSRKTDPFMALVASMVVEPVLGDGMPIKTPPVGAIAL